MHETEEFLTDDERRMLEFLEREMEASRIGETLSASDEVLKGCSELPQLLNCLRRLEALAIAPSLALLQERLSHEQPAGTSSLSRLPRPFGPYVLEKELGRGGMGVVYLARHQTLNSHFALKMIRTSEFASDEEVRRFFQEARAASRLRHPHIVSVHDAGEQDGLPYLVMRYIGGETLLQRLRQQRPSTEESVLLLMVIAQTVEYLHGEGIIHRDLKPANILIDDHDVPHLTDFGLAKVFSGDAQRTATGTVIGTPAYMAPEQAWGTPDDVSPASDIYSLGAILYELLTGRPPFPETNPLDQLLRLRETDPVLPRKLNSTIPPELEQICLRCLEKKPEHRYPSAAELAADLRRFQQQEPLNLQPLGPWHAVQHWMRRQPALAAHLGAIASVVVIEQSVEFLSSTQRSPFIPVMLILLVWAGLSVLLQNLLSRNVRFVREVWLAMDAVLFTAALAYAESPMESLVVGYGLLIVASSLWYQPRLVWGMTGTVVAAYWGLFLLRGAEETPDHYPFIVSGILLVVGWVVGSLVRKIRLLLHLQTAENDRGA